MGGVAGVVQMGLERGGSGGRVCVLYVVRLVTWDVVAEGGDLVPGGHCEEE